MKNQKRDNEQQVKEDKDDKEALNTKFSEEILESLTKYIEKGEHKKLEGILKSIKLEEFKEYAKAHGYNGWNLIHFAADRRVAETLEVLYSKLKDNKDLFFNLLKEQDKFGRTPHNIAKYDDKDNFYKKLEQILNSADIDEKTKKDIINLDYHQRELLYKQKSEESEKILAEKVLKEIENNKDGLPYFKDLKHAIEWDCNKLAREIIEGLESKNQEDKKYFIGKHGDCGWNILHFVASYGNIEILKLLCEFEMESMKGLSVEKNDDGKMPYELALDKHHQDFYDQSKSLGLVINDSIESENH